LEFPRFCGVLISCGASAAIRIDSHAEDEAAYPDEFRREAVELVRSGRSVRDVAESLGVSQPTLRNWAKQVAVDRRERDDGLTSAEARSCVSCGGA
jgi:transposase-like protein